MSCLGQAIVSRGWLLDLQAKLVRVSSLDSTVYACYRSGTDITLWRVGSFALVDRPVHGLRFAGGHNCTAPTGS